MKNIIIDRIGKFDFLREFVIDAIGEKSYSFEDFFGRCITLADTFSKAGIENSHTVFVMENSVELLACYFSALMARKIATAIDPLKGKEEIAKILETVKDAYIITDKVGSTKLDRYDLIMEPGAFEKTRIAHGDVREETIKRFSARDFNDDYLLTFTSGTTGNTKGVRHTLNNLFKVGESFNKFFAVGPDNTIAHLMPMTYMAGILNSIFQPFEAGAKIVVMGRFSPIRAFTFWQQVAQYKANMFWLSPSMLTIILKVGNHKAGQEYCANNKLLFFIGTAALHLKTRQEFEAKYPVKLFASYGLSETLFLSTETPETLEAGGGNVGRLLDGVEYRFAENGEFLVRVPWMFLGYTNEPTDHYFDGEFYKTGDLAQIEDNVLSIVGRSKDLIVKGGMNISPALIESIVSGIEGVEDCAVFGVLSKLNEELIVLAYVSSSDNTHLEKEISALVAGKLGKNYLIDLFYRTNAIPKNINGKNDKKVLKEDYQKQIHQC